MFNQSSKVFLLLLFIKPLIFFHTSGMITPTNVRLHYYYLQSVNFLVYRYLREEKLEIQLWVTYGSRKHNKNKPQHRDKLIGTIYIDLESLNDQRRKQHRIR